MSFLRHWLWENQGSSSPSRCSPAEWSMWWSHEYEIQSVLDSLWSGEKAGPETRRPGSNSRLSEIMLYPLRSSWWQGQKNRTQDGFEQKKRIWDSLEAEKSMGGNRVLHEFPTCVLGRFSPYHQGIFQDPSWVSYNSTQCWRYIPGNSARACKLRAQSHKTGPHPSANLKSRLSSVLLTNQL